MEWAWWYNESMQDNTYTLHPELFRESLLRWYESQRRILPWREDPTPYRVWISEIMLQQTRVEAVLGYYRRFLERLPDVETLAAVSDEELHKLWEGLGYYSRARNLKKAAGILLRDYGGEIPTSYDALLALPGIGPYTAGAIASIAFRQSVPAVDGNVMRVMARITADDADITLPGTRKEMEECVRRLIPEGRAHLFNQALMELGALICIPNGTPKCSACPVADLCLAHQRGLQSCLPVKKKKKERKTEFRTVLIFLNGRGECLIQKREERGLLAGMWEFPSIAGHYTEEELSAFLAQNGVSFRKIGRAPSARHIFTHIEWRMEGYFVYICEEEAGDLEYIAVDSAYELLCDFASDFPSFLCGERHWCDLQTLRGDYSVPSAFRKYVDCLEGEMIWFI